MTTLAGRKIVAAEGALPVMTRHATLATPGGVMIEWLRLSHLPALRQAGANLVTLGAGSLLMLVVTKTNAKGLRILRCARIATQLMARAAGRDVAPARLGAVGVAAKTNRMRIEAGRYGKRHASACRSMTGAATYAAQVQVTRMIEPHIETSEPGKWLERT